MPETDSALKKWLEGARPDHPLLAPDVPTLTLEMMERTLAPIEASNPAGIAAKRKAFRTLTFEREVSDQRAELLVGTMLSRAGVPYEFADPAPDYLVGAALGVEVTSRTRLGSAAIELETHFDEITAEVITKAGQKRHQAAAAGVPTILLFDLSRAGTAWLGMRSRWVDRFREARPQTPFSGLGFLFSDWSRDGIVDGGISLDDGLETQPVVRQFSSALHFEFV